MYVASIVLFLLTIDAQTVFNVASVKNASDKKFIEGFTSFLTLLDAKLGAEVEAGAAVSDAGMFVAELGAGSIIGAELSRYNRPGYRNARFPSQFTIVANGYVEFLVLPKSMIINVNNQVLHNVYIFIMFWLVIPLQDDSIKKMDSFALEQLQQWCDVLSVCIFVELMKLNNDPQESGQGVS